MPLDHVYTSNRSGGDPLNGIAGGGGEVLPLPGYAADGTPLDESYTGYRAQAGDLLVMSFCAASINTDTVLIDGLGNPIPTDTRSWTGFMVYPGAADIPLASAVAVLLGNDFSGVAIKYGGGDVFGFLDEAYGIDIYTGVSGLIAVDLNAEPVPDEITFGEDDLAHTDIRARAILGAVGHRVGSIVTGFPTLDQTGEWESQNLVSPGFNAARLVAWVAPEPLGRRWQEYALPLGQDVWIPVGDFIGQGSVPAMTVGVLYLQLDDIVQVTRQFPRDDGYGLIGGGRVYPPVRRGRVFGGQQ